LNFSRKISQHIAARAASKQSRFAFAPEGLHLDRSFTETVAIEVEPGGAKASAQTFHYVLALGTHYV
jgi:hypothetical protein